MAGLFSSEHYELMAAFERAYPRVRLDKEPKELWSKKHIYQNGETNELFLAYRNGFAYGRASA